MPWTVETLDVTVDAEIAALPISLQARLIRLFEMVEHLGLERIHEPHAKHLRGKLWELRAKSPEELREASTSPSPASEWSSSMSSRRNRRRPRQGHWLSPKID